MMFARPDAPAHVRLVAVPGALAFYSSYSVALTNALKSMIPGDARKWDPAGKRWLVAPSYGPICYALAKQYLGVDVTVPPVQGDPQTEARLIRVDYLGRCKDRGGLEPTAFGHSGGDWSVIIPQSVLLAWFQAEPPAQEQKATLYAVLGIGATSTTDEIKSAHRRAARQWHPDVCREPNAGDMFKAIQHAYTLLSDPMKRKKYDAGRALEASLKQQQQPASNNFRYSYLGDGYQAPLRCGYLFVEGQPSVGRFSVSAVLQWEDIQDDQGRVAVVSWPKDAKTYSVEWV